MRAMSICSRERAKGSAPLTIDANNLAVTSDDASLKRRDSVLVSD